MEGIRKITARDMGLINDILQYTKPDNVPLSFMLGGRQIKGIPAEFAPKVHRRLLTANTVQCIIEGTNKDGLTLRGEYIEYRDFPVTEWVVYITNNGNKDTKIISDVRLGGEIKCPSAVLEHGNGDTLNPEGYSFVKDAVDKPIRLTPTTGTSCQGAFPYMKLHGEDREIRLAIGWPTKWVAEISPTEDGVMFNCGQERCNTLLHPGETFRTPRLNIMAYTNEDAPFRGINLWRQWYLKHILPRENGQPVQPNLCLHYFEAEGKPEFTAASEENQLFALNEYVRRGMKPDVWWVDAGWYPCDYNWARIGTWHADPARFPNGLAPIGKACGENGARLLLWFEPERVVAGEEIDREHSEWLLKLTNSDGHVNDNRLFDLGNHEAREWLKNKINGLIKEYGVRVYRQDFNFDAMPYWVQNETEDRIGMMENLHGQGYLDYWDSLVLNNPGLWIDSCAAGGRRNDLETMRRAVTLHYTDVGYGNHPIKQKQHREMFEWIPYFRAHNMSWDNPKTGGYGGAGNRPVDEFAFHCALTPALTSMIKHFDDDKTFEMGIRMDAIWREAAELELSGDYYPMTPCNGDPGDWYAMQFDNSTEHRGFVQAIRNIHAEDDEFPVKMPCIYPDKKYVFTDRETGESFEYSSKELCDGFTVSLPKRKGVIFFYTVI